MAYTIYRNVKVLSVQQEKQSRMRRPQEIADPTRTRGNYQVTVASFSNVGYTAAISDFRAYIQPNQMVSVAINDKMEVIAVINHTTGTTASLKYSKTTLSDVWGILFFISIPGVLLFIIAKKAYETEKYHNMAYYIIMLDIIIIALILAGVNKQYIESKRALREMTE